MKSRLNGPRTILKCLRSQGCAADQNKRGARDDWDDDDGQNGNPCFRKIDLPN